MKKNIKKNIILILKAISKINEDLLNKSNEYFGIWKEENGQKIFALFIEDFDPLEIGNDYFGLIHAPSNYELDGKIYKANYKLAYVCHSWSGIRIQELSVEDLLDTTEKYLEDLARTLYKIVT
ncbi:MAG: hypothetical protein ACO2O4_00835 [Minisyncoccia bacterium]|jgi:hypothetical protein